MTQEDQYARWLSACRLAAQGRSLADASFESEVRAARELLQLQRPAAAPAISAASLDIDPDDYVPPRFAKRQRSKVGGCVASFVYVYEMLYAFVIEL